MAEFKTAVKRTWRNALTRRNATVALFVLVVCIVLLLNALSVPDRAMQVDWRSTWLKAEVEDGGDGQLLEEPFECRRLDVEEAKPLEISPGRVHQADCTQGCRVSPKVQIENKDSPFSVLGIVLSKGPMTLQAGSSKSDWTLTLGAESEATLDLPKGTTLRGDGVAHQFATPGRQDVKSGPRLTLFFRDCGAPRMSARRISSLALSEVRGNGYVQSHVVSGTARFLAFKDRTVEIQQGGQIDLSNFASLMRVLSVGSEIVGRAEGSVEQFEMQRGATKRDYVPSLLEWLPEWHWVEVVIAAIVAGFAFGNWLGEKDRK